MKLGVAVVGGIVLVAGLILMIIGGNEISAMNSCLTHTFCFPDAFFGARTSEGIYAAAYSVLEIGIVLIVAGAILILLAARSEPKK